MKMFFTPLKQSKLVLLLAMILATGLLIVGCSGSDSYTNHTKQALTLTPTPLIEPATLKSWMDQGLVNAAAHSENVVILQVSPDTAYDDSPSIPGAYLWDQGLLNANRLEGLAFNGTMTATGETMDAILQPAGVNGNSTIVLTFVGTGAADLYRVSRAYFHLRYWGFPKERIKLLNGGNAAWEASIADNSWDIATYGMDVYVKPEPRTSSFSVRDNGALQDGLRYSIGEMLQAVDANLASMDATTTRTINIIQQAAPGAHIILHATGIPHAEFSKEEDGLRRFKTAEELVTLLETNDINSNLVTITHCVSATSCAPSFFALDAILGWPAAIYDGSASQWNAYRGIKTGVGEGGVIPNTAWDTNPRSVDTAGTTATDIIDPKLNTLYLTIDDPRANQIENEDWEYMLTPRQTTTPPSSVGGGAPSGC
ncbi:rhodanese-like protein [Desulfurispirillum indicum S5]|uniref:Rhodanese-like protein n=1 Tax=Desulfurispirillum indicum (strain ATCC BAA-1389 / DSM 22839 / S5) TaxID=653733 RepID=E6W6H3_DESIS|nr:selenite/tellurite reduction operon rhodanese-like protein ExtH [Desulfurispirillum indicum]ADU67308.1 rhodanese-like protein [Desulfurispirillum indicum S5]